MTKPVSPEIMKRLTYAKFLYESGIRQAESPMPFGAFAMLTLHDSVEFFLQAAVDHFGPTILPRGKSPKSIRFIEYWDHLNQAMEDDELGFKEQMKRLDSARGELKHKGHLPSMETLEECKTYTKGFFDTNTPRVFALDFDKVSLVALVTEKEVVKLLETAEEFAREGKYDYACTNVAKAFYVVNSQATKKLRQLRDLTQGPIRPSIGFATNSTEAKLGQMILELGAELDSIRKYLTVLALGIDLAKYTRFLRLVPRITQSQSGGLQAKLLPSNEFTPEGYRWCSEFVIESAFRVEQFEASPHTFADPLF